MATDDVKRAEELCNEAHADLQPMSAEDVRRMADELDRLRAEHSALLAERDGAVSIATQVEREAGRLREALEQAEDVVCDYIERDNTDAPWCLAQVREIAHAALAQPVAETHDPNATEDEMLDKEDTAGAPTREPCTSCDKVTTMIGGNGAPCYGCEKGPLVSATQPVAEAPTTECDLCGGTGGDGCCPQCKGVGR